MLYFCDLVSFTNITKITNIRTEDEFILCYILKK